MNNKLCITERDMEVFNALKKYHLTGKMVFDLSQTFALPFANVNNARARLGELYQAGFLNRDQRLLKGRSNNQNYYFLTAKSACLFEELEGVDKKKAVFQPIKIGIQGHSFMISEIMVKFSTDLHQFKDICQFLGFIRENNFMVTGDGNRSAKPDGSIFISVNGKNNLLFLEVDLSTETVDSPKQETRSFKKKLEVYSEFKKYFQQDEVISQVSGITGYRVLVVCKSEQRQQNLLNLAERMNKTSMFWFTTQERFFQRNCLFDRIWALPGATEPHSLF